MPIFEDFHIATKTNNSNRFRRIYYYSFGMAQPERSFEAENDSCQSYKDTCTITDNFGDFSTAYKSGTSVYDMDKRWFPSTGNNLDTITYNGNRMLKMKAESADSGFIVNVYDTLIPNRSYTINWEQYRFGGATNVRLRVYYHNGVGNTEIGNIMNNADGSFSYSFNTNSYQRYMFRFDMPSAVAAGKYVLFDNIKLSYQDSCLRLQCPNASLQEEKGYRFAFNGKEKVDEPYGNGNMYDYGFRIYNPRLGRFLSVDPLTKSYPMLTPFQFASNTPIQAIDIDGLEASKVITPNKDGSTTITVTIDIKIINQLPKTSNFSLSTFESNVKKEVSNNYDAYDKESNTNYVYKVNFKEVDAKDINPNNDYYMAIVDDIKDDNGNSDTWAVGKVNTVGNSVVNKIQVELNDDKAMANTAAHEIGHTLGLGHTGDDPNNLMQSTRVVHNNNSVDDTHLNNTQRKQATNNTLPQGVKPVQGAQKEGQYINSPE